MADWRTKELGDVLVRTESAKPELRPDDEFEYIDVSSVSNETYEITSTQRLKGKDAPSRARRLVRAGDVLFATIRPTLKRIAIVPDAQDGQVCSTGYYVLRASSEIDGRFLFYYLFTDAFMAQMELLQKGASYPAVNDSEVRAQSISYPNLVEQRRIVAILDEAFEAIATAKANAEKNLQNARGLLSRYLAALFTAPGSGWVTQALGEAVRFIDYRGKTPPKRESGVRLITAKNVKMGFVQRNPEEFIEASVYDTWMTRGFPKNGDVLFTTEAPLGNVAQLDTDEKVVIGQRLITMQPLDSSLDRTFLKYALMSPPIQESIHARGTGATVLGIKASLLKTVSIWYPRGIEEQKRIASLISALEAEADVLSDLAVRKVAALDELQKSLLHQAFTGELTAQTTDKQLAEVA